MRLLLRSEVVSSPMPVNLVAEAGMRARFFIVDATTARLNVIAELFDTSKLTPQIGAALPLADV
jgi:hypothetical protein